MIARISKYDNLYLNAAWPCMQTGQRGDAHKGAQHGGLFRPVRGREVCDPLRAGAPLHRAGGCAEGEVGHSNRVAPVAYMRRVLVLPEGGAADHREMVPREAFGQGGAAHAPRQGYRLPPAPTSPLFAHFSASFHHPFPNCSISFICTSLFTSSFQARTICPYSQYSSLPVVSETPLRPVGCPIAVCPLASNLDCSPPHCALSLSVCLPRCCPMYHLLSIYCSLLVGVLNRRSLVRVPGRRAI